jgi:hypothetical protein
MRLSYAIHMKLKVKLNDGTSFNGVMLVHQILLAGGQTGLHRQDDLTNLDA